MWINSLTPMMIPCISPITPVFEIHHPPKTENVPASARQLVIHAITVHDTRGTRTLHKSYQPETIGTVRTRRMHGVKNILQDTHDTYLPYHSVYLPLFYQSIPIHRSPHRRHFLSVVRTEKGMDSYYPCQSNVYPCHPCIIHQRIKITSVHPSPSHTESHSPCQYRTPP